MNNTSASKKKISAGILLLFFSFLAISRLSNSFIYGQGFEQRPLLIIIALLLISWIGFFLCFPLLHINIPKKKLILFIFFVGLLLRLPLFFSSPIQEDDFYRYMWDGNVLLYGLNPYANAPQDMTLDQIGITKDAPDYHLAKTVKERINYPTISTIYPPIAQLVFALSQFIGKWNIYVFRLILLFFDIGCFYLIISCLKNFSLSPAHSFIYFWNPLLIKEIINSMHYDIVCAFFIILCLYCLQRQNSLLGFLSLVCAFLTKITPLLLILLFFIFLYNTNRKKHILPYAVILSIITYFFYGPNGWAHHIFNGLLIFSSQWQINSSLFSLLRYLLHNLTGSKNWMMLGIYVKTFSSIALLLTIYLLRKNIKNVYTLTVASVLILFILFLVSPCGNPWYLIWLIPLLCFVRLTSPLLLGYLLSFYYAVFYFEYHNIITYFWLIQLLAYVPVYLLFLFEIMKKKDLWKKII